MYALTFGAGGGSKSGPAAHADSSMQAGSINAKRFITRFINARLDPERFGQAGPGYPTHKRTRASRPLRRPRSNHGCSENGRSARLGPESEQRSRNKRTLMRHSVAVPAGEARGRHRCGRQEIRRTVRRHVTHGAGEFRCQSLMVMCQPDGKQTEHADERARHQPVTPACPADGRKNTAGYLPDSDHVRKQIKMLAVLKGSGPVPIIGAIA